MYFDVKEDKNYEEDNIKYFKYKDDNKIDGDVNSINYVNNKDRFKELVSRIITIIN